MKRVLILSLVSFYLLLTTGMFVCIFHCAVEHLIEKADNHKEEHHDDKCKGDKDCDCCKKHDNFVIKENIKPWHNSKVPSITLLFYPKIEYALVFLPPAKINTVSWPECHAPPAKSGKSISIMLRSLQI